ncbi:hypothetical protein BCR37DRAFT_361121 [Protomyces lactucae-debilis]|uniref:ethanolamine-phosphate cytidylyltransferase n=1 Tax=Protomyces lactucae-debilis TaxID=2754530 RepID=A0A1Y2F1L0_PROLT|nr:uncharacterized protein BCR37DRAFT_361121 [Protomyces lactucae-debilis]ORY77771.1 hypothetical protein BCR37DRAFT_361121 [Protomyces lactucae-debilis]
MSLEKQDRVFIDGCMDMLHHGHSGAIRQAKLLARHLVVGVHSDEEISFNKGIPVMNMDERCTAAAAVKWTDEVARDAPYAISLDFIDDQGCHYVVHGDDITTDANGVDCYQEVKDKGRFMVCKRTPAISTTDLVGRMLLHSREHHYGPRSEIPYSAEHLELYKNYATGPDAETPMTQVYRYRDGQAQMLVDGQGPSASQEVVYVDGGWDLFSAGHIEVLKAVKDQNRFVVVGIHEDRTINQHKGFNYPIMNLKERTLTVLACRYVDAVVMSVPFETTKAFLATLPFTVQGVFHGPLPLPAEQHGYEDVMDMLQIVEHHRFEELNAGTIVKRIIARSDEYLERQRKKGIKATNEAVLRAAEVGEASKA